MAITIYFDVAAIITAVVWPVVIGILIVRYRHNIRPFLKDVSKRISKFSIGPGSIDLAEAKGLEPDWKMGVDMDVRQTGISGFPSYASKLVEQIQEKSILDYDIFDLGNGVQWLSTRLYLFTIILQRMRGLKNIVFIDTHEGIRLRLVGIGEPDQVRYPWLEPTFAKVYGNLPNLMITSVHGSVEKWVAEQLILCFLKDLNIQDSNAPPPPLPLPPLLTNSDCVRQLLTLIRVVPNESYRGLIDEIDNVVGRRLDFIRKNLIKNLYLKEVVPIN